jgi:hypothetical protein
VGLFTAVRASSAYEKMLEARGVDPRSIPPDVHTKVCSYTSQQYERTAKMFSQMRGWTALEANMHNSAELVAFCVLGPKLFTEGGGDSDSATMSTKAAAESWLECGPEGSLDTMIIKTLDDANLLNSEFVAVFKSVLGEGPDSP